MSARTASSGTSAIHVSTQPQTIHHVDKSVDFFFALLIEWSPPPLASQAQVSPPHEQKPPYERVHEPHPNVRHKSARNNPIDIIYIYI